MEQGISPCRTSQRSGKEDPHAGAIDRAPASTKTGRAIAGCSGATVGRKAQRVSGTPGPKEQQRKEPSVFAFTNLGTQRTAYDAHAVRGFAVETQACVPLPSDRVEDALARWWDRHSLGVCQIHKVQGRHCAVWKLPHW